MGTFRGRAAQARACDRCVDRKHGRQPFTHREGYPHSTGASHEPPLMNHPWGLRAGPHQQAGSAATRKDPLPVAMPEILTLLSNMEMLIALSCFKSTHLLAPPKPPHQLHLQRDNEWCGGVAVLCAALRGRRLAARLGAVRRMTARTRCPDRSSSGAEHTATPRRVEQARR